MNLATMQILIDGRNPNSIDIDGCRLPTLVYLSREKRPQKSHNFKAGSMNALVRKKVVVLKILSLWQKLSFRSTQYVHLV